MILYHGSAVETFVPTFGLGKEDLIENDPRNKLEKTFKDIV